MFSGAQIAPDFMRYGVAVSPMMRTLGFTTLASAMNCRYIPSSSAGTMWASSTMIRSTGAEVARLLPDALDARDRDGVAEVLALRPASRCPPIGTSGAMTPELVGRLLEEFLDVRGMTTQPFQWPTASRQIVAMTGVLPPPVGDHHARVVVAGCRRWW